MQKTAFIYFSTKTCLENFNVAKQNTTWMAILFIKALQLKTANVPSIECHLCILHLRCCNLETLK